MSTPFQIIWLNNAALTITEAGFPVAFPGTTSVAQQLQVASNALQLQTFETLTGVSFFLVGDAVDVNIVQNIWTTIGGISEPQLNGGLDISFDNGQTYTRFDSSHGVQSISSTWIPLPASSVGSQGIEGNLSAFDTAYFLIRFVIPPGATQYGILNVSLGIGCNII